MIEQAVIIMENSWRQTGGELYEVKRERPINNEEELLSLYEELNIDPNRDGAYQEILELEKAIRADEDSRGFTVNISGAWGIGKTTYVNVLTSKLSHGNLVINARSMFYGNFDEYIDGFFSDLYTEVYKRFGIKLDELNALARQTTISLEAGLNTGIFSFKASRSTGYSKKKSDSSDTLLKEDSTLNRKLVSILPSRVVVVIDDLDRLKPYELVTALRLIEVLRQLNGVIVIAVGNIKQLGDLLEQEKIPDAHRFARKVFDHRIHLRKNLRDIESTVQGVVGNIYSGRLAQEETSLISEAFHFLVIRQIIRNILQIADNVISSSDAKVTVGGFFDKLIRGDDPGLGPIYRGLKDFYDTRYLREDEPHNIWVVRNNRLMGDDWRGDGLALLTSKLEDNNKKTPPEARAAFEGIKSASYWAERIIPSPHDQSKIDNYDFSLAELKKGDIGGAIWKVDNEKDGLAPGFLGKQKPETRWSIARRFLADTGRDELERDNSLPELLDLRQLSFFAKAVAARLEDLSTEGLTELQRLKLFVECVDVYEKLNRAEKGEL